MNMKRVNPFASLLLILLLSACGLEDDLSIEEPDLQTNSNDISEEDPASPFISTNDNDTQVTPLLPVINNPDPDAVDPFMQTSVATAPTAGLFLPTVPSNDSVVESPMVDGPDFQLPQMEKPDLEDPVTNELPQGSVEPATSLFQSQKDGLLLSHGNRIRVPGEDGGSAFRVSCDFTHDNYDDAIIAPNKKDAAHHHSYFGNNAIDYKAHNDPERINDSNHIKNIGRPSCRGGTANRSAYWMPTLYDASGKPQDPEFIVMYYKPGEIDHKTIQPFPEGLTIIAGNAGAVKEQDQYLRWTCFTPGVDNTPGVDKYNYTWPYPVVIPTGDAACQVGDQLKTHLRFPQCWDGVNLKDVDHDDDPTNDDDDHPDNPHSHMAYMINPPGIGYTCPDTHPVPLPRLSFEFRYDVESGTTDGWHLSSDRMNGLNKPGGMTFHADWMNGWDTEILNTWVKHCINEDRSCNDDLGNGTWLLEDKTMSDGVFSKYVGRPMIHDMDHPKILSQHTMHSNHEAHHSENTASANVETHSHTDSNHSLGSAAAATQNHNPLSGLGTNLDGLTDWSQSVPFVDVMRIARPFPQQTWADIEAVKYDPNGWPAQLNGDIAYTVMHGLELSNNHYNGLYTVVYEGEGKLEYTGSASLISTENGKDQVNYQSGSSFHLKILESNNKNPVRNIKVILPGGICENDPLKRVLDKSDCKGSDFLSFAENHEKLLFNPDFKKYISSYSSIRFMDWMHTNNSPVMRWADNKSVSSASWSPVGNKVGAPIEIMVELANQVGIDPWFTMPHMADDDYVRKFAEYVKQNLSSELTPYLEYSNEVWNGSFEQYNYALEQGRKLGLDNSEHWYAASKYYARRSVEMFKIWEDVFGSSDKFTRVLASQFVSDFRTNMILEFENAYKHADALAVAPYFSTHNVEADKIKSLSDVFAHIDAQKPAWIEALNKQAELAERYSLDLIAYEGGQHQVQSNDERLTELFIQANRDPRMGEQYTWHLDQWKKAGGKHFVVFTSPARYSKWGSWGIKEYITQPRSEAPKYDAVLDWMEDNPKWW